ncbi:MAG: DNA-binding protein [Clostridia bacterium]|nr:DNA-binding protein [Clostridia bacterium]
MNLFVCIDDTDNFDSIGTGELLENMMGEAAIKGLAECGFTVRYQLFIHDDIPYTSHNSSMCCSVHTDDPDALTEFCGKYLEEYSAEGSDPGLCILADNESLDYSALVDFGKRAQNEVLTKADAREAAEKFNGELHLSEHGGTGDGIIGALAGAALRAGKEEGRIKGKLQPLPGKPDWTSGEFADVFGIERFADENGNEITQNLKIRFVHPTKLLYGKGQITAVIVSENGSYMPKPKIKTNKEKNQ